MKTKFTRAQLDSGIIDFSDIEINGELSPVSPGEILLEEFLSPLNMSARALAREIHVPANRITEIIKGDRSITADTALRLAHRFGGSAEFWMNLQVSYDLEIARRSWRPVAAWREGVNRDYGSNESGTTPWRDFND